jgi:hypothetical protein
MIMRHPAQILSGSLAASCFVAFTQVVSRGNGDLPAALHWGVMLFAAAIPLLVACSLIPTYDKRRTLHNTTLFVAWLLGLAGIFCLFLSFGGQCATAFVLSIVAAFYFFANGQWRKR